MYWLDRSKFLAEHNVCADEVIACNVVLDDYIVGETDNFDSWTLGKNTFEAIVTYVVNWLDNTVVEYDLARDVFNGLMRGLIRKDFTTKDIWHDEPKVRDYINNLI